MTGAGIQIGIHVGLATVLYSYKMLRLHSKMTIMVIFLCNLHTFGSFFFLKVLYPELCYNEYCCKEVFYIIGRSVELPFDSFLTEVKSQVSFVS